jgi:hypothetical protein
MDNGKTNKAHRVFLQIEQLFLKLPTDGDPNALLQQVLDAAIEVAGADKGAL